MHETLGIAVCDDDKYYLDQIQSLISDILTRKGIEFFMDIYKSGEELIEEITDLRKYDIIFLDIEMQELDGMEVAKQIRKFNYEMDIVFITVVMKYIGKGYKVNAFRYILKDEISEGIYECLEAFLDKRQNKERTVELSCVGGSRNIKLKNIIYLESRQHRVYIFLDNGEKLQVYERLDVLEGLFHSQEYVRIHKSFLVNMGYIHKIYGYQVFLREKVVLPVAKSRYGEVKEKYLRFKEKM